MKPSRSALLLALSLLGADPAVAKTADREQPVNVVAKRSDVDNKTGNVVYTGQVVITQGTLKIRADKVTLFRNKAGELDKVVAEGAPAHYDQLTDKDEPVQGQARRIEYTTSKEQVLFLTEVTLTQAGGDTMKADRVEYDTVKSTVQATASEGGVVTSVFLPSKKNDAKPAPEGKPKP